MAIILEKIWSLYIKMVYLQQILQKERVIWTKSIQKLVSAVSF